MTSQRRRPLQAAAAAAAAAAVDMDGSESFSHTITHAYVMKEQF